MAKVPAAPVPERGFGLAAAAGLLHWDAVRDLEEPQLQSRLRRVPPQLKLHILDLQTARNPQKLHDWRWRHFLLSTFLFRAWKSLAKFQFFRPFHNL
jgi:hypothetical protein